MLSTRIADDFRDTLATGAALFQRGEWKYGTHEAAVETLWLLGAQGLKAFDDLPRNHRQEGKSIAESGFYVLRDGWERTSSYLFIDAAARRDERGHAHSDPCRSSSLRKGVTWLVDPGTLHLHARCCGARGVHVIARHNTQQWMVYPNRSSGAPSPGHTGASIGVGIKRDCDWLAIHQ
jgi:hypothetical protein